MKKIGIALTALLPFYGLPADAEDVTGFSGYGRAGAGGATGGGTQSCFQLPGAPAKYRLGNECEFYWELEANHEFHADDGKVLKIDAMTSLYHAYGHTPTFDGPDGDTRLPQIWASLSLPALKGASIWGGRRYYKRHDIHLNDFYYWNPTGLGGGLEDYQLGNSKYTVSYAFFREDTIDQPDKASRHDFHLNGWQPNPDGSIQLGFSYIQRAGQVEGAHSGWSFTAEHIQANFLGSEHHFVVQYGEGPGIGLGQTGDLTASRDVRTWRIIESPRWQLTPKFSGMLVALAQKTYAPEHGGQTWYSFGVRPVYAFKPPYKLLIEFGHDQINPEQGDTRRLDKITIAPALGLGGPGVLDRPEIRLYYTYAHWNRAAQQAATPGTTLSETGAFGSAFHGSNFGIQLETWW